MVYICAKKIGGKKYYYLRKSFRIKKRTISKEICYLGRDLSKINFKKLEKEYPQEMRKSRKKIERIIKSEYYLEKIKKQRKLENQYFDEEQLMEINAVLMHYTKHFRKLRAKDKNKIIENFKIKFITESISMESAENSIFKSKETEKILNQEITPRNKSIISIYKITNTKKVIDYLERERLPINLNSIEKIPKTIFENIFEIEYRRKNWKMDFTTSKANDIKKELKLLLRWFHEKKNKIHPLALAVIFHHKFEKIHPFTGLNGETGRILINHILHLFDYPPVIILKKLKKEYYAVMDKAYPCLKKDFLSTDMRYYKPLIDFMQKQFVKTYWNNFLNDDN